MLLLVRAGFGTPMIVVAMRQQAHGQLLAIVVVDVIVVNGSIDSAGWLGCDEIFSAPNVPNLVCLIPS